MKRKAKSLGYRSIRGVVRANDGWMFVVQAFGIPDESTPRFCRLMTLDQLGGNLRKKAESWTKYLDGPSKCSKIAADVTAPRNGSAP